jgi:L1 cell adhesion molecule like protein
MPQIEITYDVDANGILNVSAVEKSSGKSEKITVTNDKGRLSADEVERMVADAEKFKEEDKLAREKVDARNSLESYAYQVKNTLSDDKLKDKFSEEDKKLINEKTDEVITWLDNNYDVSKEEYDSKYKSLESVFNPIMSKTYTMPDVPDMKMPTQDDGPSIEEVD